MGYKEIVAGDKKALVLGARFIESPKTGTKGIEVSFQFTEPGTGMVERLNWVGWLSDKAIENTMNTLANVLGFNGDDTCDDNGVLTSPGVLDLESEVTLVVELEEYQGNQYPKIKWVNKLGGSAFSGVTPQVVKSELSNKLKAAFLAAKQGQNTTNEVPF